MAKKKNGGYRMLGIRFSKVFSFFPLGNFFSCKVDLTLAKKLN